MSQRSRQSCRNDRPGLRETLTTTRRNHVTEYPPARHDWHIRMVSGTVFLAMMRDNFRVAQLSLFSRSQVAAMRDRTKARNYSAAAEEFRREHKRHRDWGLAQRHSRRLRQLRERERGHGRQPADAVEDDRPDPEIGRPGPGIGPPHPEPTMPNLEPAGPSVETAGPIPPPATPTSKPTGPTSEPPAPTAETAGPTPDRVGPRTSEPNGREQPTRPGSSRNCPAARDRSQSAPTRQKHTTDTCINPGLTRPPRVTRKHQTTTHPPADAVALIPPHRRGHPTIQPPQPPRTNRRLARAIRERATSRSPPSTATRSIKTVR
jgi:hypothetical protein